MSLPPVLRLLIPLAIFAPGPCSDAGHQPPESIDDALATAWQNAATGLFNEANTTFASLPGDEARLGEAVTLLTRQPKTDGNVNQASVLLADLVKRAPTPELAAAAHYYLGRIEQSHRTPANPAEARRIYRELIAAHPRHPYADLATVKLAVIELYERLPDTERRARFDRFAALAPKLQSTAARRDLCLLLADSSRRFGYEPSITLDLLLSADRAGIARRLEQSNTWIRIGQLAQENGRPEVAREYYEKYLSRFMRDNRRRMVSERLAALPPPSVAGNQEAAR